MQTLKNIVVRFVKEEQGAGLIEYVLLVVLIALACVAALGTVGGTISNKLGEVNQQLSKN